MDMIITDSEQYDLIRSVSDLYYLRDPRIFTPFGNSDAEMTDDETNSTQPQRRVSKIMSGKPLLSLIGLGVHLKELCSNITIVRCLLVSLRC